MSHAASDPRGPTLLAPDAAGRRAGETLVLDSQESRHARALRLDPGAPLRLTDGAGSLWSARLASAGERSTECVLESRLIAAPLLPVEVAFGLGNKTHVMWLVEKAVELGVRRLRPVESERTRSVADAARSTAFWDKARRRAVSAMKQSGGAWLPEISDPCPVERYVAESARTGESGGGSVFRVRLDGNGEPLRRVLESWEPGMACLAVGPEGGWSAGEVSRFDDAGFRPAALGQLVLRFETAAVAALAVVSQHILSEK